MSTTPSDNIEPLGVFVTSVCDIAVFALVIADSLTTAE